MKGKSLPVFVAHASDPLGMKCLEILRKSKPRYPVQVLHDGEQAPVGSIALYAGEELVDGSVVYRNQSWPSRHLRVAAHRIYEARPAWAESTPFVVAVRENKRGHLDRALLDLANMYARWFRGEAGVSLPWETWNGRRSSYQELMEGWFDLVQKSIGDEHLNEILASKRVPAQYHDRGGAIVYLHFPHERVISVPGQDTGNAKFMSFGTSSLASPHDFLQAVKAAVTAKLPLQFFTYGSAYDVGRHLRERLLPSLAVFGEVQESDLEVLVPIEDWNKKAIDVWLDPAVVSNAFAKLGLTHVTNLAAVSAGCNVAEWYRRGLMILAEKVLAAMDMQLEIDLIEETLPALNQDLKVSALAKQVQTSLGHPGNILNGPNGENVPSDLSGYELLADYLLRDLFAQGWWFGGAAIYYLWYKQAETQPFVSMVNDGDWGKVNLLAREWLENPHGLYAMPVGYYRIYPKMYTGEVSHTAIDPWVLLELFHRWGDRLTNHTIHRMWDVLEAPLQRYNIGKRTYVEINELGINVRIVDPVQ